METSRDSQKIYRGGLSTYVKARADLKRWMKERPRDYFTSMFDFYRLPTDFLGMNHSAKSSLAKVKHIVFGKDNAIDALREETIQLLPEEINNGPSSSLSKRIISKLPNYDKVVNGVSVTKAIGVDTLCNACPHFKEWIDTLKTLTVSIGRLEAAAQLSHKKNRSISRDG